MAPPLVKGRALARRRVSGVVFLIVIGLLVQTAVWLYQKRFVQVVHVTLQTNRIGNQLTPHADVKVRGVLVGEVRAVHSEGDGATLDLALDPDRAKSLPRDVSAQLLPKTLFGEKQVVLVLPAGGGSGSLRDGDVISQDHSSTALETETALNDLLPLLKTLQPQKVSEVLTNLSTAVRGRGNALGSNLALAGAYFARINPHLPASGADLQGLADLANNLTQTSPDLLVELDNLAASSRSLVDERAALDTFLRSTQDVAASLRDFTATNEQRLTALAHDSLAPLNLFASYSNIYPCMLNRIAFSEKEGERVFGGKQPGLHITVEATQDHGGYAPGQSPLYKDTFNAGCFGLLSKPIIPFPAYRNPPDGYNDGQPAEDPGKGPNGCCQSSRAWYPEIATAPPAAERVMPASTTVLDALLLAPIMGSG